MGQDEIRAEKVVDSEYYYEGIPDEDREEAVKRFFRTKDKKIAAFLKARGFPYRGMEKIVITNAHGKRKTVIAFCFEPPEVIRRTVLDFWNRDDSEYHNVNAKLLLAEVQNINSLIANFY